MTVKLQQEFLDFIRALARQRVIEDESALPILKDYVERAQALEKKWQVNRG